MGLVAMNGGVFRSQVDSTIGQQQAQDWRLAIEQRAGLVNARISDHLPHAYAAVYPNGIVVKVGGHPLPAHMVEAQEAKRGVIKGFSKASRRRLLRVFASIDWSWKSATRVELTYPRDGWRGSSPDAPADCLDALPVVEVPRQRDWERWKYQLSRFHLELRRRWGKDYAGAIWKLEFQKRGAPHYHLVIFWNDQPPLGLLRVWLSNTWYRVVGSEDIRHLKAGTRLDPVYGTRGHQVGKLMSYLSKYLGKTWDAGDEETGRIWGCWDDLPIYSLGTFALDRDAFIQLTRRIRRWGGRKSHYLKRITANWRGFLLLGDCHILGQLLADIDMRVEPERKPDAEKGLLAVPP